MRYRQSALSFRASSPPPTSGRIGLAGTLCHPFSAFSFATSTEGRVISSRLVLEMLAGRPLPMCLAAHTTPTPWPMVQNSNRNPIIKQEPSQSVHCSMPSKTQGQQYLTTLDSHLCPILNPHPPTMDRRPLCHVASNASGQQEFFKSLELPSK